MPIYINPNSFVVHLTGPNGEVIKVSPYAKIDLPVYFDKYKSRGFLQDATGSAPVVQNQQHKIRGRTSANKRNPKVNQPSLEGIQENAQIQQLADRKKRRQQIAKARKIVKRSENKRASIQRIGSKSNKKVVGRRVNINATQLLHDNLKKINYPISNNIGIGILSYQRPDALKNLVNSIIKYTDLQQTTVFISDDASDNPELLKYLDQLEKSNNFVVIKNEKRLGVAGNSNRLIRCLSRFKYGMLLNDDTEILAKGWDRFYIDAMKRSKMHHFLYQQEGLYGCNRKVNGKANGVNLLRFDEKPHGAILAFSREMLVKCGYFDESYGYYGMEHVDWSSKAWEMGLQNKGFFDVAGSDLYFSIYKERTAVENRGELLNQARKIFDNRESKRLMPSKESAVPEVSYVIPFRNLDRQKSIETVVNNVRAQKFPVIHILMVEQDQKSNFDVAPVNPVIHNLVSRSDNTLFNKSIAFNSGVSKAPCNKVILHDADMLAQSDYTSIISSILDTKSSCHIGSRVLYADHDSTDKINLSNSVGEDVKCERVVGYYEGGSLACNKEAYWRVGAFNEDFWGYGCEDCDFYARLASDAGWFEDRSVDLLHLWHSRTAGWNDHHDENKRIEATLNAMTMINRIKLQHKQLEKNGYKAFISKKV